MTALELLLSPMYDGALAPEHLTDLRKSGVTDATIRVHKIMSVPPSLINRLLGFVTRKNVVSAMLIPFPDPRGGFMDHIRMKVFPPFSGRGGQTVKYLQPKGSGTRLFFPLSTLVEALHGDRPLYLVEGEKKSLAVAQLRLPTVGFCGIEGWHLGGSYELLADFDAIRLQGRVI